MSDHAGVPSTVRNVPVPSGLTPRCRVLHGRRLGCVAGDRRAGDGWPHILDSGSAALSPNGVNVVGLVGAFTGGGAVDLSPFGVSGLGIVPIVFRGPDGDMERVAAAKATWLQRVEQAGRRAA